MPDDMTGFEYVLLGRSPYVSYFGHESRHDRAMVASVLERLDLVDVRRSPARHVERRRAAAAGHRPRVGAGGAGPAARRAHQRARHRPPAAGAWSWSTGCAASTGSPWCRRCTTSPWPGCTPTGLALLHEGHLVAIGRRRSCAAGRDAQRVLRCIGRRSTSSPTAPSSSSPAAACSSQRSPRSAR